MVNIFISLVNCDHVLSFCWAKYVKAGSSWTFFMTFIQLFFWHTFLAKWLEWPKYSIYYGWVCPGLHHLLWPPKLLNPVLLQSEQVFVAHVDPWCQENMNPYGDPDLKSVNSQICKQTFRFLNRYANVKCMNNAHLSLYFIYLIDIVVSRGNCITNSWKWIVTTLRIGKLESRFVFPLHSRICKQLMIVLKRENAN